MKLAFFLMVSLFLFLPVIQAQDLSYPTNCGEALLTDYQHVGPGGGNFSFNVTAPPTCTYSIVSISPAIVTSPNMATGNSTVTYSLDSNNSLSNPRYGVIIVGAKTFTVNQGVAKSGIDAKKTELDFNRDRNSDFVAIQNNNGNMTWWQYRFHGVPGASTSVSTWGLFDQDVPVPNDYDGDLRTDFVVWRSGTVANPQSYFYVLQSQSFVTSVIPWGTIGDDPNITQDFDGDFRADLAVTRKQAGKLVWYIRLSANNSVYVQQFGNENDRPIRGDYDGDFHSDLAVYRPNGDVPANTFFVFKSADSSVSSVTFGDSNTDKIVPGNYDTVRGTDYAVWRTTTGVWYWLGSSGGATTGYQFGLPGDLPVPADYNEDGRNDYAVFRPSTGEFFVKATNDNPGSYPPYVRWGNSGMKIPSYLMQVR